MAKNIERMKAVGRALGKGAKQVGKFAGLGVGVAGVIGKRLLGMDKPGRLERFTEKMMK